MADAWFDVEPETFVEAFRQYHLAVEPRAFFPGAEARAFRAWLASSGVPTPHGYPGEP